MGADVLEQLARDYRASLPRKVEVLADAIAARDRAEAVTLSHRLCGTSGSYGFAAVGELAGRLERALEDGADWARAEELMAGLRGAAAAAASG